MKGGPGSSSETEHQKRISMSYNNMNNTNNRNSCSNNNTYIDLYARTVCFEKCDFMSQFSDVHHKVDFSCANAC